MMVNTVPRNQFHIFFPLLRGRVEGNVEETERRKIEKDEVIAQHNDFDHLVKWSCEKYCDTDLSLPYCLLQMIQRRNN
jgi:hypothetical protein